jgi:PII-like signaling protein
MYQYIVELAKETGISGATVYRGIMGFGSSSQITSSRFWKLTEKLPVVIELVDETGKLEQFYKEIEDDLIRMPKGCMVALEPVTILLHKKGK